MKRVYLNKRFEFKEDCIEKIDKGYLLKNVETKPNGANTTWISIGKFEVVKDDFGDRVSQWIHEAYPTEWKQPGFEFKRVYDGSYNSASQRVHWSFILPEEFKEKGYSIAKVHFSGDLIQVYSWETGN